MKRRKFAIAAVYDTETCNLGSTPKDAIAYPILFIDNDIRDVDLRTYEPDRDDNVNFLRHENEYIDRIEEYIRWGKVVDKVPIICAYNLMFDLQPLMQELGARFDIQVNAQSSTNVYTLDLYAKGTNQMLLRFWDTFHLDMRGLSRMGEVAGLQKAVGDWDYSLVRTPDTPLTEQELFYAKRDTQVIPAYLKFILNTNDWAKQEELGVRILTKTSLVRQTARHEIANLKYTKDTGKKSTVYKMFTELCAQEFPKTYNSYALRKACFRGGYTFTAAAFASTIQSGVISVDVTSMHHTFINGRFIPVKFGYYSNEDLAEIVNNVLRTTKEHVLENYHKPFNVAFHARLKITNIRLRKGSAFAEWGIALCPLSKFNTHADYQEDSTKYVGEKVVIEAGFHDGFKNARFAFGKLYEAQEITIHVTEIELWAMSRVYEWDSLEVIYGEATMSFVRPPDYITLQSNMFYKLKDDNKFITNHYHEGSPYPYNIPDAVPENYRYGLKDGSLKEVDFEAYYTSDTKGKFNGIYGTMAQDVMKPSYECVGGVIQVDQQTVTTYKNFDERKPKQPKVLYTYGMRIVAGSRLHMVLAIERLYQTCGSSVRVLGGDTDSMKVACSEDVTNDQIADALDIFGTVSKKAIDKTMERVRRNFPTIASSLKGIGGFDIEHGGERYEAHLELWNKCRVSVGGDKSVHITCAGLSRPSDQYHIERFIHDLLVAGYEEETVLKLCVGYNVFVGHEICHALEGARPSIEAVLNREVRDYRGVTSLVTAHQSPVLYSAGRWLGETVKQTNAMNVRFLEDKYHRYVDTRNRYLFCDGNSIQVCTDGMFGYDTLMIGDMKWSK